MGLHGRRRSGPSVRKHGLPVVLHRDDDPSNCICPVDGSVQPAEASDQSLGEVSIPCRRGDSDGVFRSSRMIPYRLIERQWLARPIPGQGPLRAAEDSGARGPLVFRVGLLAVLDEKQQLLDKHGPRYAPTARCSSRRGGRAVEGSGLESRLAAWPIFSAISVTWPTYMPGAYPATVSHHESA